MYTAIVDRKTTSDFYSVHDIILQQEAAMRYVLEGKIRIRKHILAHRLKSGIMQKTEKEVINPALYHFVMPPWYLLFPFSIYIFSIPLLVFLTEDSRLFFVSSVSSCYY